MRICLRGWWTSLPGRMLIDSSQKKVIFSQTVVSIAQTIDFRYEVCAFINFLSKMQHSCTYTLYGDASWTCKNFLNFIINALIFLVSRLKSLTLSCLKESCITLRKSKALLPSSQSILCIFPLKYYLSFQNFLISGNFLKTSNSDFTIWTQLS